jgi:hypothetical protein
MAIKKLDAFHRGCMGCPLFSRSFYSGYRKKGFIRKQRGSTWVAAEHKESLKNTRLSS